MGDIIDIMGKHMGILLSWCVFSMGHPLRLGNLNGFLQANPGQHGYGSTWHGGWTFPFFLDRWIMDAKWKCAMSADPEWPCRAVFHVLFRTGNGISFHQYSHYNSNLSVVSLRWYPHSISIPVIFPSFPHDHPILIPSLSHNFLILIPTCSHRHRIIFSQCFPSHPYHIPMIWGHL